MKTLQEMRQEAAKFREKLEAILKAAEDDNRATLSDEEDAEYERVKGERNKLLADIEKRERDEERREELERARRADQAVTPQPPELDNRNIEVGADREARKPFRNLGEQLRSVYESCAHGAAVDKRLLRINEEYRDGTGSWEGAPHEGGFLVQTDFASELLDKMYNVGQISSRLNPRPIGPNSNSLKINTIDETSRVDGSRKGGVRGYWTDEGGTKTASKPKFGQINMALEKLTALWYATDELLQDTMALGALAADFFSEELNFKIEDAVINGDGAGKPLGILNAGCLVSVAKETGQAATTVVYENIVKMWSRMWARSRPNAVWFINQDVEPELFNLGITVGTGGTPAFMPAGGLSGSPFNTLFGRPVIPVEYCATLGTVGDIILADLSQYLAIQKGGLQSASSIHVRFIYDETTFRFVYRFNGQPWWSAALTPFKGSNTLSPFVALATRS